MLYIRFPYFFIKKFYLFLYVLFYKIYNYNNILIYLKENTGTNEFFLFFVIIYFDIKV